VRLDLADRQKGEEGVDEIISTADNLNMVSISYHLRPGRFITAKMPDGRSREGDGDGEAGNCRGRFREG